MPTINEQLRIATSQVEQLHRENVRLADQLKEVIRMNTMWQRYDTRREEYILKITKTNGELQKDTRDLKRQIQCFVRTKALKADADVDPIPEADHQTSHHRTTSNMDATATTVALQIAQFSDHVVDLKEWIIEMNKNKESRRRTDEEEMMLLREQIEVCIEDFKRERKDRERIHVDNENLRKRLVEAERGLTDHGLHRRAYRHRVYYGDHLTPLPRDVEIDAGGLTEDDYDGDDQLVGGGRGAAFVDSSPPPVVTVDGADQPDVGGDDGDTCEVIFKDLRLGDEDDAGGYNPTERQDADECPRCRKTFAPDKYTDMIKHFDGCLE